MANAHNTTKVDILHPLTKLQWKSHEHKWTESDNPIHCAVLKDIVAIHTWNVLANDTLHISSVDLHKWTTKTLPLQRMSLATYKSQFVLVGGGNLITGTPTNSVLAIDTGLEWQPSLPPMKTKRMWASSVGTTLPEAVLVVAGGKDTNGRDLDHVEVLIEDIWYSVDPLPKVCYDMAPAFHQNEVVFTDRHNFTIYSCNIASLISSGTATSIPHTSLWSHMEAPGHLTTTTLSYSSRLVNIDGYLFIRVYSSENQPWIQVNSVEIENVSSHYVSATTLPTRDIIVACATGLYKVKVLMSSFDPESKFESDIFSKLEVVMGIHIISVVANHCSQLTITCGVKLKPRYNFMNEQIPLPDPQRDPVQYVNEVILQWSMGHSHRPPTLKQLLHVLQDIGLMELSQQIEAFLKGTEQYYNAYRHFISTKDILEMLFLKLLFLGQPRQGKTTARRRFMGEIDDLESAGEADQPHASTGAVECGHDMIVKGLTDTTAVITGKQWSAVNNLSDEARMLFHILLNRVQSQTTPIRIAKPEPKVPTPKPEPKVPTPKPEPKDLQKPKDAGLPLNPDQVISNVSPTNPTNNPEISAIIRKVSGESEFWKNAQHYFKAYLRLEDSGGQPELMDMLPALTIGPGLYLLFFSYECHLKEIFPVHYEKSSGKTMEESVLTLEEMLLSSLSNISCSNSLANSSSLSKKGRSDMQDILESSKSVAYMVGTHRDKVSEEYVASFDQQLQQVIRDTDLFEKGVVKFFSENQLVISMDNMKGGKDEVSKIRQVLEKAMEKHFKKLRIPGVWLLFSLCLRMRDVRTASMETCLELSRVFNMTPYETKVALWFLHHHAGVLMYFPNVSGLEDLVIIDIQVVYDSITSVILKAISFDKVDQATAEKFRSTGQFSMQDLVAATSEILKDLIPPFKLVALLEYLHIVARIVPTTNSASSSKHIDDPYIMPCVLRSANKAALDAISKNESRPMFIASLRIRYVCGFVPIGVFSAMAASFIGNSSFILKEEGMMKNLIQFHYGCDYALITFLARPKSYEIVISQLPRGNHPHILCSELRKEIETTFDKVSSRMNYGHFMDYQFGFECPTHPEEDHVCVVNRQSSSPQAMLCLQKLKNRVLKDMQGCHKVWFGEPLENVDETTSTNKDIPSLRTLKLLKRIKEDGCTEKLKIIQEICSEWKNMGDLMGFTVGQLNAIEKNKHWVVEDCCREVFSCWLEKEVKGDYPVTWEGLCELLEDMERSELVETIKKFISK